MWAYRILLRRQVVVNLESGEAVRGVLWQQKGPLLVLRNAEVASGGDVTPADGEIVIERSQIRFMQVL